MAITTTGGLLSQEQIQQFHENGYLVVRALITPDEVKEMVDTGMDMNARGESGDWPIQKDSNDPLQRYPRLMHPHKINGVMMRYMLHPAVMKGLHDLFGEEALAAQSMFYFKPPGARGQALHQDNFYLRVEPGTCIAAWIAVDPADQDNGGMLVVPGSHDLDTLCPGEADMTKSFVNHEVKLPDGLEAVPCDLASGDVLFFNGSVIHGSNPNTTTDRFRRSFIGHYVGESTLRIGRHYVPLYRIDGTELGRELNNDSLPCGSESDTAPH